MAQVVASADAALPVGHPMTKPWIEQRWVLDNIIQANGVDWDQPRSQYWNAPCGIQAAADFARVRQRVKKYADISIEFEDIARRREKRAREAEAAGEVVSARENYFIAAIHWGAAQWPIDEANELNRQYNQNKRDCFGHYAKLADHHVEAVWIPFGSKALPVWFHLPVGYAGGQIPVVVTIPGMDSFKEASVAMYGDSLLNRGFGVLAVDGPGKYESPLLGIYMTVENWEKTGQACMEWLLRRPEVDSQRVGISGRSFGSFGATLAAANEPRFRAVAVSATCFEPGFHTIFEEASPTFKKRFMFMANISDEAAFDDFAKKLTWEGQAEKIHMPFLCIAGDLTNLAQLKIQRACSTLYQDRDNSSSMRNRGIQSVAAFRLLSWDPKSPRWPRTGSPHVSLVRPFSRNDGLSITRVTSRGPRSELGRFACQRSCLRNRAKGSGIWISPIRESSFWEGRPELALRLRRRLRTRGQLSSSPRAKRTT